MLLPSSTSNPANMMAQALSIYKSLIGNGNGDTIPKDSHPGSKLDTQSGETGDKSHGTPRSSDAAPQTRERADTARLGGAGFSLQSFGGPGFSLQSSKKVE